MTFPVAAFVRKLRHLEARTCQKPDMIAGISLLLLVNMESRKANWQDSMTTSNQNTDRCIARVRKEVRREVVGTLGGKVRVSLYPVIRCPDVVMQEVTREVRELRLPLSRI